VVKLHAESKHVVLKTVFKVKAAHIRLDQLY
jgi:hypothetical protein